MKPQEDEVGEGTIDARSLAYKIIMKKKTAMLDDPEFLKLPPEER